MYCACTVVFSKVFIKSDVYYKNLERSCLANTLFVGNMYEAMELYANTDSPVCDNVPKKIFVSSGNSTSSANPICNVSQQQFLQADYQTKSESEYLDLV